MSNFPYVHSPNTTIKSGEVNANNNAVWPTGWTAWTPTYSANVNDWTTVTGTARYCQIGNIVFAYINVRGTPGAANQLLGFTVPIVPKETTDGSNGQGVAIIYSGAADTGIIYWDNAGNKFWIKITGGINWPNAANNGISSTFFYEIA